MRGVVAMCVLAGCGRFGFGDQPVGDGRAAIDTSGSAADAPQDTRGGLPGLLAYWPMEDDPSDGTIDDVGPGMHAARCVTGISCPTQVAGKHGTALHVDGNQFATVTYGAWLGTSGPFTYAAWIYIEQDIDQVAFARPVGTMVADSWDAVLWSVASGNGTCIEDADSSGANQAVCGATSPLNQWIQLTGRWDGAVAAFFMNGVKVGQKAEPAVMFDTSDLILGADWNTGGPAYQFHGRIDDLQLYDRALTDAEITVLAQ